MHIIEPLLSRTMRYFTNKALTFDTKAPPNLSEETFRYADMLYIHIPFCRSLCPYCSFHKIAFSAPLVIEYFQSLERELQLYADRGASFDTVYIGGGTPTVLPERLAALISGLRARWPIKQISVESIASDMEDATISILQNSGVNRLSIGIQTFQDELRKTIKRNYRGESGLDLVNKISVIRNRFDTVNIDMMFNLPGQTERHLKDDLELLKKTEADQITYYPLMSSGKQNSSEAAAREAKMYKDISGSLSGSYKRTSAWCFTRKEGMIDEYIVTHSAYAAAGSGAFGYGCGTLYANTFSIQGYIDALQNNMLPVFYTRKFGIIYRLLYELLMKRFGGPFVTNKGTYVLVVLMKRFFEGVNNLRDQCRASVPDNEMHCTDWRKRS